MYHQRFSGSRRENVALGHTSATRNRSSASATICEIDNIARRLAEVASQTGYGYGYVVLTRGSSEVGRFSSARLPPATSEAAQSEPGDLIVPDRSDRVHLIWRIRST
eukprot:259014_1